MPFETLERTSAPTTTAKPDQVRASCAARVHGSNPVLRLTIGAEIARALGWRADAPRLSVDIGTGKDAGKLRLRSARDGAWRARVTKTGNWQLWFGGVPGLALRVEACVAAHEVLDERNGGSRVLSVTLPRAFIAAPLREVG